MHLYRQERHQVDHVDKTDLQLGKVLAKNADRGQAFKRWDVTRASEGVLLRVLKEDGA